MTQSEEKSRRRRFPWGKVALLGLLTVASVCAYAWLRDELTLAGLARQESRLRAYYQHNRLTTYALVFVIYAAMNGVSVPGAGTALTLFLGWFFRDDLWLAVLLVSFGSTAGALMAFLLSRYLLRDLIEQRYPARVKIMQGHLAREGAWYLLTLRLLPVVPYFLINILMGLTTLRAWTFWWVSQLGMLPATLLYTYTASTVPDLEHLANTGVSAILTPQLLVGLTLLALFPLTVRRILLQLGRRRQKQRGSAMAE